jgi:hypothetical protein
MVESSYIDDLGLVLRQRNPDALRQFLVESASRFGDQRQVDDVTGKSADEMVELMHRMIVARPDLADLHRASREWLFKQGIDSYGAGDGRRN